MICNDARKQIVPYIKNQLSMDDTYKFINHVNGCSECMDELEIYYILEHGLSDEDDVVSYDFKEMLNKQLADQKREIEDERLVMSYYKLIYDIASIALLFSAGIFVLKYII